MQLKRLLILHLFSFFFFNYLFSFSFNANLFQNKIPDLSDLNSSYKSLYDELLDIAVSDFVSQMNLRDKAAQLFHVSFPNEDFLYNRSDSPVPGGFLYFAFNVPTDCRTLIRQNISIRNFYVKNKQIPPFYSLDCEGGDVNRLRPVTGRIMSPGDVAEKLSVSQAENYLDAISQLISAAGFDMNLAPVIEPLNEDNISFLDNRSYGSKQQVQMYASIFIKQMFKNRVYPVVKHYPGNTNADPHLGLPVLYISNEEYQKLYVSMFEYFLSNYPVGVLAAHTVVPSIDSKPVCLSEKHIHSLKEIHEFSDDILILSDDLLMSALTKNGYPPVESVIQAVEAGIDIVMLTISKWDMYLDALLEAANIDENLENSITKSCSKIIKWKCKQGILSLNVRNTDNELHISIQNPGVLSDEEIDFICNEKELKFNESIMIAKKYY